MYGGPGQQGRFFRISTPRSHVTHVAHGYARTAASRTRYGVDALDPTFNSGRLHWYGVLSVLLRQPTIVFNQAPVMGQGGNQMV